MLCGNDRRDMATDEANQLQAAQILSNEERYNLAYNYCCQKQKISVLAKN